MAAGSNEEKMDMEQPKPQDVDPWRAEEVMRNRTLIAQAWRALKDSRVKFPMADRQDPNMSVRILAGRGFTVDTQDEVEKLRAGSAEPELSAELYHQLTGKPLDVTSAPNATQEPPPAPW